MIGLENISDDIWYWCSKNEMVQSSKMTLFENNNAKPAINNTIWYLQIILTNTIIQTAMMTLSQNVRMLVLQPSGWWVHPKMSLLHCNIHGNDQDTCSVPRILTICFLLTASLFSVFTTGSSPTVSCTL